MLAELESADLDPRSSFASAVRRDRDLQRQLCDPNENPHAAAFFVFNFCVTQDEERQGAISLLPDPRYRPHGLNFLEALDAPRTNPHNIHDEKARRMWHTWLVCLYNLWAVQWVRGYSALLISKTQDHVDDSGRNEQTKVFSLFARMRFAFARLPDHVRRGMNWGFMTGTCPENDAWLLGRAPTKDAGRGAGSTRAYVDECAFIAFMAQIHAALDPACKDGKVYLSSVNGPVNTFAKIKKQRPAGWKFYEEDWKNDPAKTVGLRETVAGPERDRFGSHVSPYFEQATASLTDEEIAQEYLRKYDRSTVNIILREFNPDVHIRRADDRRGRLLWNPKLELRIGLDPGHMRKCAATAIQVVGDLKKCNVIGAWAGVHRNSADNAKELVRWIREGLKVTIPLDEIVMVPDPASFNEELGSGLEIYAWYRAAGLTSYELPRIQGPDSVYIGNNVLRVMLQRNMFEIDEIGAAILIEAIPDYRLPMDPITHEIRSNKPVHNMSSHPVDSWRYPVTSVWTADDLQYVATPDPLGRARAPRGEGELLDRYALRKPYNPDPPDDEDDDDDDGSGLGSRTLTSSLHGKKF